MNENTDDNFQNLINWKNLMKKSHDFKTQKPFNFAFVEDFFTKEFYDKLYDTYPKIDESWEFHEGPSKSQYGRYWNKQTTSYNQPGDDPSLSESWNLLKRYSQSDEFISNFREFSGVPVKKMKYIMFMSYRQGGFQFPHIHNVGPSTIVLMFYFSKNWEHGDPGGTYMAETPDEDSIIFEPYNLDNSLALFLDGPKAAHGVRYIPKNVVRQGFQIILEGYSDETGWTGTKEEEDTSKDRKIRYANV